MSMSSFASTRLYIQSYLKWLNMQGSVNMCSKYKSKSLVLGVYKIIWFNNAASVFFIKACLHSDS